MSISLPEGIVAGIIVSVTSVTGSWFAFRAARHKAEVEREQAESTAQMELRRDLMALVNQLQARVSQLQAHEADLEADNGRLRAQLAHTEIARGDP